MKSEISILQKTISACSGDIGICAIYKEGNFKISIKGDERFPMASTYKIAIAAYALKLWETHFLDLEKKIDIMPEDLRMGSGILTYRLTVPGVSLSLKNLVRLMIEESDNTASDLVLNLCGGPQAVTDFLARYNITGMSIDSSILEFFADEQLLESDRDTTTPEAMANFLLTLQRGEIISAQSFEFLFDCMKKCRTGVNRIKAGLPDSLVVGQKTGTMTGIVNDVGIITLPGSQVVLVIAIFIKNARSSIQECEQTIAQITRRIYEYVRTYSSFCLNQGILNDRN